MTYSRYDEDKVVWKANLTQEDALGFNLDSFDPSERELMDDVQTEIMDKPDENIVRIENPCHFVVITVVRNSTFRLFFIGCDVTRVVIDVKKDHLVYASLEKGIYYIIFD